MTAFLIVNIIVWSLSSLICFINVINDKFNEVQKVGFLFGGFIDMAVIVWAIFLLKGLN